MKVASVGYINDQRFTYFIIFEILRLMLIVDKQTLNFLKKRKKKDNVLIMLM